MIAYEGTLGPRNVLWLFSSKMGVVDARLDAPSLSQYRVPRHLTHCHASEFLFSCLLPTAGRQVWTIEDCGLLNGYGIHVASASFAAGCFSIAANNGKVTPRDRLGTWGRALHDLAQSLFGRPRPPLCPTCRMAVMH